MSNRPTKGSAEVLTRLAVGEGGDELLELLERFPVLSSSAIGESTSFDEVASARGMTMSLGITTRDLGALVAPNVAFMRPPLPELV